MSRLDQRRLHIPKGIYSIFQRVNPAQPIFQAPADYDNFGDVIAPILKRRKARLHAFAITTEGFHLVLQVKDGLTGPVMGDFKAHYAIKFHQVHGTRGKVMLGRYRALLIDPRTYLLPLVRYINSLPNVLKSSHAAYLGEEHLPWLTKTLVTATLASDKGPGAHTYQEAVAQPLSPKEIELFGSASWQKRKALGSPAFMCQLRNIVPYRSSQTLEDIIESVASQYGVEIEDLLSRSRREDLREARAKVVWSATERKIATLADVARRLGRTPQTMLGVKKFHLEHNPHLFSAKVIPITRSIVPSHLRGSFVANIPERGDELLAG